MNMVGPERRTPPVEVPPPATVTNADHLQAVREAAESARQSALEELQNTGYYSEVRVLGQGSFGVVAKALDGRQSPPKEVAVKLLPRGRFIRVFRTYVKREILHQSSLRHPFIISILEVKLLRKHLAIVMEYAPGGDLFRFVLGQRPHTRLPEGLARWIFQQLTIGLDFCHHMGVANRDLKLENLLLARNANTGHMPLLKICDFGYSKHELNSPAITGVGTPIYMAPEIIFGSNKYDAKQADIWSIGIILYIILFGNYPFNSKDPDYPRRVVNAQYTLPDNIDVSESGRDLVRKLLVPDPHGRATMDEIKVHPWFLEQLPANALTMNDWWIRHNPELDQIKDRVNAVVDQAQHDFNQGDELVSVAIPQMR